MIETYTSTGLKILRHLDYLQSFQNTGIVKPISLQIAPTSRCNLNCCFCSNVNRQKHEDLSIEDLLKFMYSMEMAGAKTVEWTGGGDPTQYEHIKDAIYHCSMLGLSQVMITNGIDLVKIGNFIHFLDWIRISLNSLEYVDDIEIPPFKGTLGFSYVWNEKTTPKILNRLNDYVNKYHPTYVRIVPNCQISAQELEETNLILSGIVENFGKPYFYQSKRFSKPDRCWWGHFKPFLLHDGYIYPCSSVVLNNTAKRSFHKKFRWMSMEEFIESREFPALPYDCADCTCCVFGEQNNLIEALINQEMEEFI
jgi:MoaA/NifB/PqqE/SkfB family radical SAM enzyme